MIILNLVLALLLTHTNPTVKSNTVEVEPMACNAQAYKDLCVEKLPDGYTFLKSYTIDGKNGARKSVRYSYIFSKNTSYLIMLANTNSKSKSVNKIKVTLYDSNGKKLASSYSKGRYYPGLSYKCNATGIYFMKFQFDGSNFCAGSVLAFKR